MNFNELDIEKLIDLKSIPLDHKIWAELNFLNEKGLILRYSLILTR